MGIFDAFGDVADTVKELFDSGSSAVKTFAKTDSGKAIGAGIQGLTTEKKQISQSSLNQGLQDLKTPNVTPGRTDAVVSVNPKEIENYWLNRLSTFAEIERETGVKVGK